MRPLLGTYLRRSILLRIRLLDIQNISDGKCFNPFVLALFFPVSSIQHPNHITKNICYEYGLNLDGTASPASLKGIYRFEKQSPIISIIMYMNMMMKNCPLLILPRTKTATSYQHSLLI